MVLICSNGAYGVRMAKEAGKVFIVDTMYSFACVDIPVEEWGIDFLVRSTNKGIQGVPGFSLIICRRDLLLYKHLWKRFEQQVLMR